MSGDSLNGKGNTGKFFNDVEARFAVFCVEQIL